MQTFNRKQQPQFHTISKINIIKAEKHFLHNGIPVYYINGGEEDVVKLDIIFDAGSWNQKAPLVASSTHAMMNEGTKNHTSLQIADKIDYYGAYLAFDSDKHESIITLLSLNKHLDKTLEILEDIIKYPVFPEHELSLYLKKRKHYFLVEAMKVENKAANKFASVLFGKKHPYGRFVNMDDFEKITKERLLDFYKSFYRPERCKIVAAGKISDELFYKLNTFLGENKWNSNAVVQHDASINNNQIETHPEKKHFIAKNDATQSSIKIGKLLFNKTHPDFMGMQILSTIIGGYFGSRLMKNIREIKGYTYGIYASMVSLKEAGYFAISSEMDNANRDKALKEIYKEINKISNELISRDELRLVRNYIMGELLRLFDGPFALSESYKSILRYNLDESYFDSYIQTLQNITPKQLKNLSNKYLDVDSMKEIIAGKKL